MSEDARTVPADTEVRLFPPSFPPHPALLDRLRTFVRQHRRVGTVYVFGMQPAAAEASDVIAATLVDGDPDDHADELADLRLAVLDVLPPDATVDLTVLGARGELDVVGAFAPVGAGGAVEEACVRALADGDGLARLATRLAAATLYVPTLDGPDEPTDDRQANGASTPGTTIGGALARTGGLPRARPWVPGSPVRWPLTRLRGHDVVSVFSSWPALLHADPPFPGQVSVPGRALVEAIPEGIGLALDPGSLHALVLPAAEVARVRQLVR